MLLDQVAEAARAFLRAKEHVVAFHARDFTSNTCQTGFGERHGLYGNIVFEIYWD